MKKILGLDLGTTSIGFAYINESDDFTNSSIEKIGVRVNPLTTDEQTNFEKGKPITINADRTLKRGARRTLDRYQLRRSNLIDALVKAYIINNDTILAEDGKNTTHSTFALRAKSAVEKVEKDEFARILLAINKKRGYKSSRKANNEDEGQAIDGMLNAKKLYDENLTPGQLSYQLLKEGKKQLPDFYRSDLQAELDKVWEFQRQFYPEILTDQFKKELIGKGQRATSAIFWKTYNFNTSDIKGSREEKKLKAYQWRNNSISQQLDKEEVAYVITEINNNLNNSSGYLGAISDRSKELYFNKQTVGQYLYKQIQDNPHIRLKNQVFYRQDYFDEFETIWETQSKFHPELTEELKKEIRDIIIFYQRKLKSQKGLISFCEFENKEIEIDRNGQKVKKTIGLKVAPKSSPLFQEFKIWQVLNNVLIRKKGSKKRVLKDANQEEIFSLSLEDKQTLFNELNIKGNLKANKIIELLGREAKEWEINYTEIEGNRTNKALYEAYFKILETEGYNEDLLKLSDKDEINITELSTPVAEIKDMVKRIFEVLEIDQNILEFDAELDGKDFEKQASYQLWHLLYAYEGDNSASGNDKLHELLEQKYGFKKEHAQILANVSLSDDYGNLSAKAIRKIYPHIKELHYDKACFQAGYKHSASSLTKEEIANRPLKDRLDLLKKNSLRNPVVEKILNQVVNVVNTLIETNSEKDADGKIIKYFKFDEIRIELARDLKKNAKERAEMTTNINSAKIAHEKIFKLLQTEFGVKNPTRNDIIRYKLYEELKNNGYKDLYTNTYIAREILFSKQVDIEHIIPQSKVFDDSFSNKTVVFRKDNLDKGNKTAYDYIDSKFGKEKLTDFEQRIEFLFEQGKKNKEEGISKAKYQKLLKQEAEIGDGFIERDLRDSQYIAKKARNMLYEICRIVTPTTGSITDKLRSDWDLINIMQELNFDKFKKLGLTEQVEKKDGSFKERIIDWSKRNDHRHHAMDALTIAFTKQSHIQYLNFLNARKNENHKEHNAIIGIEGKETTWKYDDDGNKKRIFKLPLSNFREEAKKHLENILVSHKAKNKVVTKNKNKTKSAKGEKTKIELTPRGQLHKETVYGKYQYYVSKEEKIGIKFDQNTINKISNPNYKKLLLQRLAEYGNDPKKAFTGKNVLSKNPIYLNDAKTEILPETVKLIWLKDDYSIRKDITPDNFKDTKVVDKILDEGVKRILKERLAEYNNNPKEAFSDLDKNPIWLNKEKSISIKKVKISGVNNVEALHYKKDHLGNRILDENEKPILVDFVSTGNNHHVAIYKDEKGNLQERVVSLFEAIQLVNAGEPIITKDYNQGLGWQFLFTMKQNEYFIFPNEQTGFDPKSIDLLDPKNNKEISPNLFRVQKIAAKNYFFRHHLETTVEERKELKDTTYKPQLGLNAISKIIKVRINHIGQIVKIGEY
ncbi:CRISPR-associated endonuclease Csn1 [Pedobacter psychrotolerans]|uniref:CRISPR-associated endonuclease Cas9 n=1 Tax=Pedobacter psychrotolerans TaxID=1843235 RepID=A0A4R2H8P7_9SPHI|nr:type II CRISPR RNA-guided endonuclease Cas9 [Pedobacter psychrotolerans]TCO22641.1 CRISPR-associated endonuclease Csn1 [Pedobacter psychrotolerans]GGE66024.1 CRISPR-associated endonuclease Cas9 [Pedobacter psychrotolerans]